jgi:hypothetical protein
VANVQAQGLHLSIAEIRLVPNLAERISNMPGMVYRAVAFIILSPLQ